MTVKIENADELKRIMEVLRSFPEEADYITAYGSGDDHPELYDVDVLGDFAEAVCGEEFENLKNDIVNSFYQLYSFDFQNSHEGVETFYENLYVYNRKEDVERAAEWFINNGMTDIGKIMKQGYESAEKEKLAAKWINDNTSTIYAAYIKIMFEFEEKYL